MFFPTSPQYSLFSFLFYLFFHIFFVESYKEYAHSLALLTHQLGKCMHSFIDNKQSWLKVTKHRRLQSYMLHGHQCTYMLILLKSISTVSTSFVLDYSVILFCIFLYINPFISNVSPPAFIYNGPPFSRTLLYRQKARNICACACVYLT